MKGSSLQMTASLSGLGNPGSVVAWVAQERVSLVNASTKRVLCKQNNIS